MHCEQTASALTDREQTTAFVQENARVDFGFVFGGTADRLARNKSRKGERQAVTVYSERALLRRTPVSGSEKKNREVRKRKSSKTLERRLSLVVRALQFRTFAARPTISSVRVVVDGSGIRNGFPEQTTAYE